MVGINKFLLRVLVGFPSGAVVEKPPANAGDARNVLQSLGCRDPLEEEMETLSSIIAWEIPWTEKPDRLQSTGSQRVRYD